MTSQNNYEIQKTNNIQLRSQMKIIINSIQQNIDVVFSQSKNYNTIMVPLPKFPSKTLNEIKEIQDYCVHNTELKQKLQINYRCRENIKKEKEITDKRCLLNQLIRINKSLLNVLEPIPLNNKNLLENTELMTTKLANARTQYIKSKEESREITSKLFEQVSTIAKIEQKCSMIKQAIEKAKHKVRPLLSDKDNHIVNLQAKIKADELSYKIKQKQQLTYIDDVKKKIDNYGKILNDFKKQEKINLLKHRKVYQIVNESSKTNSKSTSPLHGDYQKNAKKGILKNSASLSVISLDKPFDIKPIMNNKKIHPRSELSTDKESASISSNAIINEINHLKDDVTQVLEIKKPSRKPFNMLGFSQVCPKTTSINQNEYYMA